MKKQKRNAVIYARVSTDKQKVDIQLNELRQFAVRSVWSVIDEYIDQNYTGANLSRPAFLALMDTAHKRKFDILLV
jgi:DNA invertase Pin-like site-specific DNA recombinase